MHGMQAGGDEIEYPEELGRRVMAGLEQVVEAGHRARPVVLEVLVSLDAEEAETEQRGGEQQEHQQTLPSLLAEVDRHHHGEAAGEKNGLVDGAEQQLAVLR